MVTPTILISLSQNPPSSGAATIISVIVYGGSPAPTGAVTLSDSVSGSLGTLTLNGGASSVSTTLASGAHTLTASYAGDSNYNTSSSTLTFTVTSPATVSTLYSFSLLASVSDDGDTSLPPVAQLNASPDAPSSGAAFSLLWYVSPSIYSIRITDATTNTVLTSPPIINAYSGSMSVSGITSQTAYILECFDDSGAAITNNSVPLVSTCVVNPS